MADIATPWHGAFDLVTKGDIARVIGAVDIAPLAEDVVAETLERGADFVAGDLDGP
jgi:hypothetical protein